MLQQAANLHCRDMASRTRRIVWVVIAAFVVSAGITVAVLFLNPKKALKLVLPDLEDISLVNASIQQDTAYVSIGMHLENESLFTLTLDTLFYRIGLADSQLFNRKQVLNIRQKPGDLDTFNLPLRIPVSKTMRTIQSLQQQDSTYLDVDAYVVYNTIFGSKKIPVSRRIRIKVPVPPEIRVTDVEITGIDLFRKTVSLNASVNLVNRGDLLDLNIHHVAYSLSLGEKLISSDGVYNKKIQVKPLSETQLQIPVEVQVSHVMQAAWTYLANDEVAYHVRVRAQLDENSFYQQAGIPVETEAAGKTHLRKN